MAHRTYKVVHSHHRQGNRCGPTENEADARIARGQVKRQADEQNMNAESKPMSFRWLNHRRIIPHRGNPEQAMMTAGADDSDARHHADLSTRRGRLNS